LRGVSKAISILTSPESQKVMVASTVTFVQARAVTHHASRARSSAVAKLGQLSKRFHSYQLAKIALDVSSTGHFDQVIASIEKMIAALRQEEQEDINHRDRCQRAEAKNDHDKADINHDITMAGGSIDQLEDEQSALSLKIHTLTGEISDTKAKMSQALDFRNVEVTEFKQALKDDADAIAILGQALVALTSFYKRNRISMGLVQSNPEYTVDHEKAPEMNWQDGKYGGRKEETTGIVAIVEMIREDMEKEMTRMRQDDDKAQQLYEQERSAMQETLDAQVSLKETTEEELREVDGAIADKNEFVSGKQNDLESENKLQTSIYNDCEWTRQNFDSRRSKRKTEIQGLVDAKAYLGGSDDLI